MRRRIHAYEEEDTCTPKAFAEDEPPPFARMRALHMRRRIHAYREEDTCTLKAFTEEEPPPFARMPR
jgi:hypothetical protein